MSTAAILLPSSGGSVRGASPTLQLLPAADAWVSRKSPTANHGTATLLRARHGKAESYLQFNLAAWRGLRIADMSLSLAGVAGDAMSLRVHRTAAAWMEGDITYASRPPTRESSASAPFISGSGARFDLVQFFPSGVVDRDRISLRVTNLSDATVHFGSRESAAKPRLMLTPGPHADRVGLPAIADTWAASVRPSHNFGSAPWLKVSGPPNNRETFLKFDLSAWQGHAYESLELQLEVGHGGTSNVSAYRVAAGWDEATLTWNTRPAGGKSLGASVTPPAVGPVVLDIGAAFRSREVNAPLLAIRIDASGSDRTAFLSREGSTPPVLWLTPAQPAPIPADPPEQLYFFRGKGTDHGVGMSQHGARARAAAGQKYPEILAHYYPDTSLGAIKPGLTVRVLLANSYVPTKDKPARVVARSGAWLSPLFPGLLFPADSHAELVLGRTGSWTAIVADADGWQLARAEADDLVMEPAAPTTRFEMRFRSNNASKYDLYRGAMRLRVNGTGVQAVNHVQLNDYLRGVVPAEMPASWSIEAVRAQAVASRGYVHAKLRSTNTFDVRPDSGDQVYGGVRIEHARSDAAVAATSEIVVTYNDVPVQTFFFAIAGGHTENNEYAFVTQSGSAASRPLPYLRGRPDVDPNGLDYDRNAPGYAWSSGSFTMGDLSSMLARDSRTDVGSLESVDFERGVSSRAYRVTLTGTKGTKVVSGGVFKSVFNAWNTGSNLRSTLMFLEPAP